MFNRDLQCLPTSSLPIFQSVKQWPPLLTTCSSSTDHTGHSLGGNNNVIHSVELGNPALQGRSKSSERSEKARNRQCDQTRAWGMRICPEGRWSIKERFKKKKKKIVCSLSKFPRKDLHFLSSSSFLMDRIFPCPGPHFSALVLYSSTFTLFSQPQSTLNNLLPKPQQLVLPTHPQCSDMRYLTRVKNFVDNWLQKNLRSHCRKQKTSGNKDYHH